MFRQKCLMITLAAIIWAAFSISVVWSDNAIAKYPNINVQKSIPIFFSSKTRPDKLDVSVIGTGKMVPYFNIAIHNLDGELLYQFKTPLDEVICDPPYEHPIINKMIDDLIQKTLDGAKKPSNSSSLPPFIARQEALAAHKSEFSTLPEKDYNRLRKNNLPLFSFWSNYDCWQSIIFDPKIKKAVSIVEGCLW